jgi:hypothetical protein
MPAPTPAAHLPTRQQLDEIDALLSRMLTLPPGGGEEVEEPPAPPTPAAPPPVEMTFPALSVREVPPPQPPAPEEPVVREWRVQWPHTPAPVAPPPSVVAWGSPVPLATLAEDDEPVPARTYPTPAAALPAQPFPVAEGVPDEPPPARPLPLALWPLVGVNFVFNVLTYFLGAPGAWLRGRGRAVLGWLGVGMILAAGVWAAGQWYGYDWPTVDPSRFDLSRLGLSR